MNNMKCIKHEGRDAPLWTGMECSATEIVQPKIGKIKLSVFGRISEKAE